jgi:hypothetical protein
MTRSVDPQSGVARAAVQTFIRRGEPLMIVYDGLPRPSSCWPALEGQPTNTPRTSTSSGPRPSARKVLPWQAATASA